MLDDPETSRKLILATSRPDVRVVLVRASDVPTYVQYGGADLGVAGKDVLIEHGEQGLYQPLDLQHRALPHERGGARRTSTTPPRCARARASAWPPSTRTIARQHFADKGVHVDLIKLYGSMELAPLTGLADAIVDLVSTGSTLKANHLVEVEQIMDISSRLVVNQAALKLKREPIRALIDAFAQAVPAVSVKVAPARHARPRTSRPASSACCTGRPRPTPPSSSAWRRSSPTCARAATPRCSSTRRVSTAWQAASVATLEIGRGRAARRAGADHAGPARARSQAAAQRVRSYHQRQLEACGRSWQYRDADGTLLGQKVTPLDRVGIYVPGGKAAYPSSVLMNAIPAQVAGVGEIVMVVPTPHGERNPLVLAAAAVAGVHRVFTIGGAQAVAALAYGTATVPRVDKITGPGNAYVASAKRRVFGQVGIDMIAGPSEILVLADGSTPADWVAMDLFSQAEHDELAQSILLCPDAAYIDAVTAAIDRLLPEMPRRDVIRASLEGRGALIQTRSMEEACEISNRIAPEHLEVSVARPAPLGAAAAPCRRDLPRRVHQREPGRLLRRAEPCAADLGHGALFVAAGRLRLPEAQQPDRGQRGRRRRCSGRSPPNWPTAKACRPMRGRPRCA